jgi:hypothetical protein
MVALSRLLPALLPALCSVAKVAAAGIPPKIYGVNLGSWSVL